MLYFSKIRIISIAIFTIFFVYLTTSNFLKFDDSFIEKKINLGLDLQGGSYLLLEIDNSPVITQKLQNKLSSLRKYFKNEDIKFRNLKIKDNNIISFELDEEFVEFGPKKRSARDYQFGKKRERKKTNFEKSQK